VQSTVSLRRRVTGAVAALGAVLLTASCAAGQNAATSQDKPAIDGSYASVRGMDLRGVAVLTPPAGSTAYLLGQDAPLTMVIINNGTSTDTLMSISSSVASGFQVVNGNMLALPSATDIVPVPAATSGSGSSSTSGSPSTSSSSASASPSASTAATPQPPATVQIPAGGSVSFGLSNSTQSLFLTSLRSAVYSAATISLTVTFQNAGSVTFEVPVQLSAAPNSSTIPLPSGSAAE
jgi:copper(I)-binding protein